MSFENLLQLLTEKDPVRAGKANQPLRQLDQNIRYVYQILQAAGVGSTVYARQVTVESAANVGMAVYYNETTQQFERGLSAVDPNVSGVLQTAPSAQIWGVVAEKFNPTLADLLLFGIVPLDISAAVDGTVTPGTYYLSGSKPGMLVKQKPPVSVMVLRYTPDGQAYVVPQFVDFLDRHTHYHFQLTCAPAGDTTPPSPGEHHVITNANALLPGWLPASDASFNGNAPPGAVLGYNLAAQPMLKNAWPPLPSTQAYLEWDKATDAGIGGTGVPLGDDGLAIIDRNGIWWMSDCYGDVPWPVDLDTSMSLSLSESISDQCPRFLYMTLDLWFTKINFATDTTVVRSLGSMNSRIKVYCLNTTTPATAGDLVLDLDLNLIVADNAAGYLALKSFDPATASFKQGPMVEGLYAAGTNVTLTGTIHGTREIASVPKDVYQGLVQIAVNPAETQELDVQLVRLDGSEEQFFQNIMYLAFRPAVQESYRAKIHVPADLALPSPQMALRFLVLGRAAGTLPQLTFTGLRVPRPVDGLITPEALPTSGDEFTITCPTTGVLVATNQYVEAISTPFTVAAGDVVFFTVQRSASDGYTAEVGIIEQVGVVTSGA